MGLLDFKVYVVLALRPELDCGAQPQSIPAVPDHHASLKCPSAEYPSSIQSLSILSVFAPPNHQVFLPNPAVFLQCPWQRIPAVPKPTVFCTAKGQSLPVANSNRRVFLQCPTAEYPCSAQPCSISARPMATYPYNAQTRSVFAVLRGQVFLWCPALAMPDANFC